MSRLTPEWLAKFKAMAQKSAYSPQAKTQLLLHEEIEHLQRELDDERALRLRTRADWEAAIAERDEAQKERDAARQELADDARDAPKMRSTLARQSLMLTKIMQERDDIELAVQSSRLLYVEQAAKHAELVRACTELRADLAKAIDACQAMPAMSKRIEELERMYEAAMHRLRTAQVDAVGKASAICATDGEP